MDIALFGDSGLLVSVKNPQPFTYFRLGQAIDALALAAILDWVATPDSLLIRFDPLHISAQALTNTLTQQLATISLPELDAPRIHTIPVVYDGIDLQEIAGHCKLSVAEVIQLHSAAYYMVLMIGFLPGFPYLTGLASELHLPRRATPRANVAAGSVSIAGPYAGIYPQTSPGGWHILGHTTVRLFDYAAHPPALLRPGDQLQFIAQ